MKIDNAADFGRSLKMRRKELGYTQRYISEFTGFSISFISDLENGKSTAELGKAIYLANMLGLDIAVNARGNK
ncbi:MAG: helix-turn-helix domain-containing protein [Lachnospiraceae bacterium]|jgi:transcriptional regulator with XRE-family HTH domain|nr:helix-turn-helix domain-containing protein [Lachnospiraceae bacterium]